jgi:hypothetical protein
MAIYPLGKNNHNCVFRKHSHYFEKSPKLVIITRVTRRVCKKIAPKCTWPNPCFVKINALLLPLKKVAQEFMPVFKKVPKENNCPICRRKFAQSGHPEFIGSIFRRSKMIRYQKFFGGVIQDRVSVLKIQSRIARVTEHTKTGKIHQIAIKYTKSP